MNKEELRLGNYYIGYDNQYHQVDLYFFAQLYDGIEIDELIKSFVPINEEWLLMFGFEKNEDLGDMIYYQLPNKKSGYGVCFDHEELVFYYYTLFGYTNLIYDSLSFQFVHQLQNLYFALTNEELIIQ